MSPLQVDGQLKAVPAIRTGAAHKFWRPGHVLRDQFIRTL